MRIIKRQAYQAHPVPSHAYYPPEDPLEPDITRQPIANEEEESGDYEEERAFRCRNCDEVVFESEMSRHECEK
jgi:hypothetical protein